MKKTLFIFNAWCVTPLPIETLMIGTKAFMILCYHTAYIAPKKMFQAIHLSSGEARCIAEVFKYDALVLFFFLVSDCLLHLENVVLVCMYA